LSETKGGANGPVVIKKYANRRLYNTQTSAYVTLDHLAQMVKDGTEFEVRDARTGDDITRQVLTQIIVEEESKGGHMLPIQFLRQLIHFYGDSLQSMVPGYLEMSMDSFTRNQDAMRQKYADAFGGRLGFKEFDQLTKQNIAMFERAMRMFSPFAAGQGDAAPNRETSSAYEQPRSNGAPEGPNERDDEIRALKDQLAAMQRAIADLAQQRK
jgi:polyhydroxyalkanoate synthesis repressor PhaR